MTRNYAFLAFFCLALATAPVNATLYDDVPWPDWVGESGTLWYAIGPGLETTFGSTPDGVAQPVPQVGGVYIDGDSLICPTDVVVDNFDNPNPFKKFWFYIDASGVPDYFQLSVSLGFDEQGYSVVSEANLLHQESAGGLIDIWEFGLTPNPVQEVLELELIYTLAEGVGTGFFVNPGILQDLNDIDMTIGIATHCVPIPGAVWLLGAGLLGLLGFRKKLSA